MFGSGVARWALAVAVVLVALAGVGWGREWSEEVQLTHGDSLFIDGLSAHMALDRSDNIHLIYRLRTPLDSASNEVIYSVMSPTGQELRAVSMRQVLSLPDNQVQDRLNTWGISVSDDGIVSVTTRNEWTDNYPVYQMDYYLSRFNLNGDTIDACIPLELNFSEADHLPVYAIDSQHRLIAVGRHPVNTGNACYCILDSEGHLIDFQYLSRERLGVARHYGVAVDQDDYINITWSNGTGEGEFLHYTKISPEDDLLVDNYLIEYQDYFPIGKDFALDSNGNPIIYFKSTGNGYGILKLNAETEIEYFSMVCRDYDGGSGMRDMVIDEEGNIHVVGGFTLPQKPAQQRTFLGYACLNDRGELLDSVQYVTNQFVDWHARAIWDNPMVYVTRDDTVGVLWADYRFSSSDVGEEIFQRLCQQDNQGTTTSSESISCLMQLYAFPNPFNSDTELTFMLGRTGLHRLSITDSGGRLIEDRSFWINCPGVTSLRWTGVTPSGAPLPSGVYFFSLSSNSEIQTLPLTLIR